MYAPQSFHDLAYIAESPQDLLLAINQFLEDTVVLPPGEYDKQLLIPVLMQQSKVMARRRKEAKAGKFTKISTLILLTCHKENL